MRFQSVGEVLDFAIRNEEEAEAFYLELSGKVSGPHIQEILKGFAGEERGHKEKLLKVKAGEKLLSASQRVVDLKIADYTVAAKPHEHLSYADALVLAMKKEKAAFRLYSDLAEATPDPGLQGLFKGLAQEEAKHKLRFEVEYDEQVMREN